MNKLNIGGSGGGGMKLPKWSSLDVSVKVGVALGATTSVAAAIALPSKRDKEQSALDLFDRPWSKLTPQEHRVAEFAAGRRRWVDFFEGKVYPITRKLPGANNPVLNPYRDAEPFRGGGGDDSE